MSGDEYMRSLKGVWVRILRVSRLSDDDGFIMLARRALDTESSESFEAIN